jgi:hypothetical protein
VSTTILLLRTMRRKFVVFCQVACLFFVALSILVGFSHFAGLPSLDFGQIIANRLSFPSNSKPPDEIGTSAYNGNMIMSADNQLKLKATMAMHQTNMTHQRPQILIQFSELGTLPCSKRHRPTLVQS